MNQSEAKNQIEAQIDSHSSKKARGGDSLMNERTNETGQKVCPNCQNFLIRDGKCPECHYGGSPISDSINEGIIVPENAERQELDIYQGKAPHPARKWARLIFELRELITDDSRGIASKKKYDGKSKQEVFDSLIQRLGNFKGEIDKRFFTNDVLRGIKIGDSLRTKIGKYLRNCSQIKRAENTACWYNNLYIIKSSNIETNKTQFEGNQENRDSVYSHIDWSTRKFFLKHNNGLISPSPRQKKVEITRDKTGKRLPNYVQNIEGIETETREWNLYGSEKARESLYLEIDLEQGLETNALKSLFE